MNGGWMWIDVDTCFRVECEKKCWMAPWDVYALYRGQISLADCFRSNPVVVPKDCPFYLEQILEIDEK